MKTFISDWNEADLSLAKRQQIMRLAISGTSVYAGGGFTTINLDSCQGIAIMPSP